MLHLKKFTYINCICCGSKIQLLDSLQGVPDEEIFKDVDLSLYEPESQMWNNGLDNLCSAGYGSSNDVLS